MSAPYPLIPYGWADFRAIRLEDRLYVDKTRFIRLLENERFAFLIRPRRFGKSCWVSLLENYYDRNWADEFEQVFGGTDIGRNPTEKRLRRRRGAFGDMLAFADLLWRMAFKGEWRGVTGAQQRVLSGSRMQTRVPSEETAVTW